MCTRCLQIKRRIGIGQVVLILTDSDIFEDTIHLLYKVPAKDRLAEPELLVFCQNYVVNVMRNLWSQAHLL